MIPDFDAVTGYLPVGTHQATMDEIRAKLGFTKTRERLILGLQFAADRLFAAGVQELCIDGSFTTAKPEPGDIDGYWTYHPGVDLTLIPPILLNFNRIVDPVTGEPKFPMWFQQGIELFIHPFHTGAPGITFPDFFSSSRDGVRRGLVQVMP